MKLMHKVFAQGAVRFNKVEEIKSPDAAKKQAPYNQKRTNI